MAQAYTPPGVNVTEVVSPQVSPLLASPADVCLVGLAQGFQTRTDQLTLTGTSPITLPGLSILTGSTLLSVTAVTDALNPSKGAANGTGYTVTTDYTVNLANGTITRVSTGAIADPTLVNVTYTYVPANYYNPIRLFDLGSVESRFGNSLDPTGTVINSPLSFAASLAFQNGANSIICQPLFSRATPGSPTTAQVQPTSTTQAAATTWSDTLYVLRGIEDLDIIVPVVGQSQTNVTDSAQLAIFQTIQDHLAFMNGNQQYIVAFFGEDSSASNTVAQMLTIRNAHAPALQGRYNGSLNQQTVLLNTANFGIPLPSTNLTLPVGGQYMAAAIAGAIAARPVSAALTRKTLTGFVSVLDNRLSNDKNADAQAGLMVIEQLGGVVRCRHSVTLDTSGAARSELSVVRAKFLMIESIRATLENQIIGQIIADANSPFIVRSAISSVLSLLQQAGDLVSYSPIRATLSSLNPTTITASFSYRPAFPLNYINIAFALDLTNQTVSVTDQLNNPTSTL